jgi:uncharacterized surface protein with fasciclin (FAS1) repeats
MCSGISSCVHTKTKLDLAASSTEIINLMYRLQIIVCLIFVLWLSPAAQAQSELPTIAEIIAEDERFTVLQHMLELADPAISAYLSEPAAQLTFFAPTNEAMKGVFGETLAEQRAYAERYPFRVREIIRFHIVPAALNFEFVRYPSCQILGTALINTQQYIQMDDDVISINQVPLPAEILSGNNGFIYPIDTVLPKLNVVPTAGDHTPDEQKRPKPLDPHFGDLYPDAPLAADALSTVDVRSVLEEDGRFKLFLRLMDAAPQHQILIGSDGVYTLFIPTDTAFGNYFEEAGIDLETLPQDAANRLVAQRIVPGYMTPDYIELGTTWGGPLELCTVHWLEDVMASGQLIRDMEIITVDFDEDTGLTANGGALSDAVLYARNAVIYVTEEFRPAPGRG